MADLAKSTRMTCYKCSSKVQIKIVWTENTTITTTKHSNASG